MDYEMDFDDQMEDMYEDMEGFEYLESEVDDCDYDWGYNEDEGFDPYAGCYTWDC